MRLPISIFRLKKKSKQEPLMDVREVPTTFASGQIVANIGHPKPVHSHAWIEARRVPGVATVTQQGVAYVPPIATEADTKNAITYAAHPGPSAMSKKELKKMKKAAKQARLAAMPPPMPSLAAALHMKTPAQFAAKLPVPYEGAKIIGCSVNARGGASHKIVGSFDIPLAQYETKRERKTFSRPIQYETVTVDQPYVLPGAKVEKAKIIEIPAAAPQLQAVPVTIQRTIPVTVEQRDLIERKIEPQVASKPVIAMPATQTTKVIQAPLSPMVPPTRSYMDISIKPHSGSAAKSMMTSAAPARGLRVTSDARPTLAAQAKPSFTASAGLPSLAHQPMPNYMAMASVASDVRPAVSSAASDVRPAVSSQAKSSFTTSTGLPNLAYQPMPSYKTPSAADSRPAMASQAKSSSATPMAPTHVSRTPDAGRAAVKPALDVQAKHFPSVEPQESTMMDGASSMVDYMEDGFAAMGHGIASGAKKTLHVTARAGHIIGHRIGRLAHAANKGMVEMVKDVEEGAKGLAENASLTFDHDGRVIQADSRQLSSAFAKPNEHLKVRGSGPINKPQSPTSSSANSSVSVSQLTHTPGLSISSAHTESKSPSSVEAASPFRQGVGSPFHISKPRPPRSPVGIRSPHTYLDTAMNMTRDLKTPELSEASSPSSIASTPRVYDAAQYIIMSPAVPGEGGKMCGPSADISASDVSMMPSAEASSGAHADANRGKTLTDFLEAASPVAPSASSVSSAVTSSVHTPQIMVNDSGNTQASSGMKPDVAAYASPRNMLTPSVNSVTDVQSDIHGCYSGCTVAGGCDGDQHSDMVATPMSFAASPVATPLAWSMRRPSVPSPVVLSSLAKDLKTNVQVFSSPQSEEMPAETASSIAPPSHMDVTDHAETPSVSPESGAFPGQASPRFEITKDEVDRYNISDQPEVSSTHGANMPPTHEAVLKGYESSLKNVLAQKSELQRKKLEASVAETNDATANKRVMDMGAYVDEVERRNKNLNPLLACCGCQMTQ